KYGLVFHKGLVHNSPAQRNGWEVSPTIVFAKSGGSICPEAGAKQILVFIRIVGSTKIGHDAVTFDIVTAGIDNRSSSQIPEDVPWKTFTLYKSVVPIIVFPVGACHCLKRGIVTKFFLILQESFSYIFQPCVGCIHAEAIGGAGK